MWYCPDKKETYSTHWQIRISFQYVGFPVEINDSHLEYIGVYPLVYDPPIVEGHQIAEPSEVLQIDGQWVQQWAVRDRTPEEMPDYIPPEDPQPEDPPVDPNPEEPVQSGN